MEQNKWIPCHIWLMSLFQSKNSTNSHKWTKIYTSLSEINVPALYFVFQIPTILTFSCFSYEMVYHVITSMPESTSI